MEQLQARPELAPEEKTAKLYAKLNGLVAELRTRGPAESVSVLINEEVSKVNSVAGSGKDLKRQTRKSLHKIIAKVEKEHKWVPKGHYRNLWMGMGMAVFGVPLGVSFGLALGNIALMGIGFPIGLAIGLAIGNAKDTKAKAEGRQLELEE